MSNSGKRNKQTIEPSKLTPQQIQEQEITGLLQAPLQFGTNKTLINVNAQSSKLKSNKNAIVNYTLEQPIKLNIGDKVTLIESFVEERGLSIDTISFEDDVEEELRFLYYQQGDCQNSLSIKGEDPFTELGADQKFAVFPNPSDMCSSIDGYFEPGAFPGIPALGTPRPYLFESMLGLAGCQGLFFPTLNYTGSYLGGEHVLASKPDTKLFDTNVGFGATGQYYYGCEWFNPAVPGQPGGLNADPFNEGNTTDKLYMRPLYGAVTIKIPAGNYSVSALSDLINSQLNGFLTENPNAPDGIKSNALNNKLFNKTDQFGAVQTMPFFDGITADLNQEETDVATYNPDSLIIGEDTHQAYQRRRGGVMAKIFFNPFLTGQEYTLYNLAIRTDVEPNITGSADYQASWAYVDSGDNPNSLFYRAPIYTRPVDITTNFDKTLFNQNSSTRVKFRRFQSNFFLHIDGFRTMWQGIEDEPETYLYYHQERPDKTLIENTVHYDKKFVPRLQDMLLAKLGGRGQYYFTGTPRDENVNHNYNADSFPVYGDVKMLRYPDFELGEVVRFSCLFPVSASFNELFKGNDAQKSPDDVFGAYQQYAGTASFTLEYDTTSANRFSLKNLHEPFKLPTTTPDTKTPTNLGGQQATLFNTPLQYTNNDDNPVTLNNYKPFANYAGVYPIDSKSGIAINNFAFNAVKETSVYKQLVSDIETLNTSNINYQLYREKKIFDLFTKPFEDFFTDESSARDAWSKTFWSRLGFTYEQFGQIDKNLEKVFSFAPVPPEMRTYNSQLPADQKAFLDGCEGFSPPEQADAVFKKQLGIVTHNSFNFSFIPSSDSLGVGNVNAGGTAQNQNYDMRGYTTATTVTATPKVKQQRGVIQNYVHILTDSQPINANTFPSLNNGNNYLLIDSDIVKPNAKDANSNSSTIVGVMSKENASNDTIFSVNPVTFTITEPKLLATIQVKIRNPDGTLVSDEVVGKNNAFIFQIEKAIAPGSMTMEGF